ncbi:MAG TPA: polyprenyl synthetase family protein [Phycisphaerales bacterium]|nr:polyprenyl synthetase family protein [Phycisphaerales bacterium]
MSDHPVDLTRLFAPVQRIDAYLTGVLDDPKLDLAPSLREAMKYAVLNGGKRLRPLLAWYCCEALGAPGEASLPAGAAVEFVHAFSLVHDDLPPLDNDDLRRGKPTLHKHAGEAMAILAGDALLALSFDVLARCSLSSRLLSRAVLKMINGQVLDTLAESQAERSPREQVALIHEQKTGALLLAAAELSVSAADQWLQSHNRQSNPAGIKGLAEYTHDIGLLFQIVDDLIDVEQPAESAGKRTGKDAAAGKLTYPAVFGIEHSKAEVARLKVAALAAIAPLGPPAQPLRDLAHYLATRTK